MTIRDLITQSNQMVPENLSEDFLEKEVLCENFCPMRFNRYASSGNFLSDIEGISFELQDDFELEEITITLLYYEDDTILYELTYSIDDFDEAYENEDY